MSDSRASGEAARVLVIRGGALGDFILTLPVLSALRVQFPEIRLEVLGYPHIAQLATLGGLVDAVHPIEARSLAGFFAHQGVLDEGTADFFAEFALIISFLYDPDEIFQGNVARCSKAQFIAGPHRPAERGGRHATDSFLQALEKLAIFDADSVPRLRAAGESPGPGSWLAAHPGSGSETKNWPERRWAELLRRVVAETRHQILLVGGEAEGDRLDRLAAGLPRERLQLARSLPLGRLAGLLSACGQFIGHDSGITHLATALGVPALVLWGPSDPRLWRPRGENILVLQDDTGLPGLATDTVWEVLRRCLTPAPVA